MSTQFGSKQIRIAMAQLNFLVGDIKGNSEKIIKAAKNARYHHGADIIIFPELALTGYPPEDLLFRENFSSKVEAALNNIKNEVQDIYILLGFPFRDGKVLYNSAALLYQGKILSHYNKHCLPNYSVFDEKRYFVPGSEPAVVNIKGIQVGITICEDIWYPGPMANSVAQCAELILNINASPFHLHKDKERVAVVKQRVLENNVPVVYVNLVGGQDELVFDGASFIVDQHGEIVFQAPSFEADVFTYDFSLHGKNRITPAKINRNARKHELETVYKALVTGVRDYVEKNGFPGAVLGLSGGIDSGLTLAIAVDALGADRVEAVMMPSRYTSAMSIEDATKEAKSLGVEFHIISIEPIFESMLNSLSEIFAGTERDVTEENLQARCRGVLLMAISNKRNKIVLTTGNKSEMAVGYATLYGDMAGGFNALKDVPKTLVYKLAEYRNTLSPVIPQTVIHRAPSAELAPNQKDADSLPDYGELDCILELYVERDMSGEEIAAQGYDIATVNRVIRMVDRSEYKRRQAAPGIKISRRAFGRDRRYPITAAYNNDVIRKT